MFFSLQHHDSVAGTAKQNVNDDVSAAIEIDWQKIYVVSLAHKQYELLLESGRAPAFGSITSSMENATGFASAWSLCPLANVTLCAALEAGQPSVATIYNTLGQPSEATPVRVPVGLPPGVASWAVLDDSGRAIVAQLVPLSPRDVALRALYNGSSVAVQWLCFTAKLPAAGFAAFFLVPAASTKLAPLTYPSQVKHASESDTVLTNGRLSVTISSATGFLSSFSDSQTGVSLPMTQVGSCWWANAERRDT